MNGEEPLRAALYARVSTDEQAEEGFSLEAQLDTLRTYCDIQGYEIAGEFVDDGYSGRNTNRPAFRSMFDQENRSKWDVLLVYKMDRIHRNSRNFMNMMDDLARHRQQFISTYDKIDTSTAVGRFVTDMIIRLAQLESEQTGERTYFGMHQKAVEGSGILGFNAPFGYRFGDGGLQPDDEEADVVRSIYSMYLSGMTMDSIAYSLNRDRCLTRKGNPWNKFNLRTILHNPVYAGYLHWEDVIWKGGFTPIIETEEFDRTQVLMASRVRNPRNRHHLLLSELEPKGDEAVA